RSRPPRRGAQWPHHASTRNARALMSTWIRNLLIGLALVLVLLLGAAAWLLIGFDGQRYQQQAVDWVATHTERRLAFDGPVHLSVFPRLAVRVAGVRLSEAGSDRAFAAVEQASVAVEWLPLLRGRLVADRIQARGVRFAWRRDAAGRSNVDGLLRPAAASAPAEGAGSAGPALPPQIAGLLLEDVRVQLEDEAAGIHGEVRLDTLSSGPIADAVATP